MPIQKRVLEKKGDRIPSKSDRITVRVSGNLVTEGNDKNAQFSKNHHSFMLCCLPVKHDIHPCFLSTSYFSARHEPQATKFIALLFAKIIGKRRYWQDYRRVEALSRIHVARNANRSKSTKASGTGPEDQATQRRARTFVPKDIQTILPARCRLTTRACS